MNFPQMLAGALTIAWFLCWITQFAHLMMLKDEAFPNARDKMIWVVVFVVLFLVAPFGFMVWKQFRLEQIEETRDS